MKAAIAILILFLSSCARPLTKTLDGSRSYDPDGYIVKWYWKQVSGEKAIIINPFAPVTSVLLSGPASFELQVTDNDGATSKDTTSLK